MILSTSGFEFKEPHRRIRKRMRTTQDYAKVLDKKVSNDMMILRERYTSKGNVKKVNNG